MSSKKVRIFILNIREEYFVSRLVIQVNPNVQPKYILNLYFRNKISFFKRMIIEKKSKDEVRKTIDQHMMSKKFHHPIIEMYFVKQNNF